MKRTRVTDERIVGMLAGHEAGATCADPCREHGMSEGAFCNWKARSGGLTVSEARRLKALGDENATLKKLLAGQMLDLAARKELVSKKRWRLPSRARRSRIRALGTAGVPDGRGGSQDGPRHAPDTEPRGRLRNVAHERRRFGCRRLFVSLRREGEPSGVDRPFGSCPIGWCSWGGHRVSR